MGSSIKEISGERHEASTSSGMDTNKSMDLFHPSFSSELLPSFQVLVQYLRQTDEVLFWINEKVAFVSADEFGHDLEHVEVLQRKFDEFQKDMATQV